MVLMADTPMKPVDFKQTERGLYHTLWECGRYSIKFLPGPDVYASYYDKYHVSNKPWSTDFIEAVEKCNEHESK